VNAAFCPSCGKPTVPGLPYCPGCGADLQGMSDLRSTPPAATSGRVTCPNCGQADEVRPVSAVWSLSGFAAVGDYLSPPSEPEYRSPWNFLVWALVVCGYVLYIVPGVVLTWWFWKKTQARHAEFDSAHLAWRGVMERWDATEHCARCQGVFIPAQTPFIPAGPQSAALFAARPG
jgi:hypothetical protein